MNADVVLTDDAISMLLAHLESDPRIAVVGPRILADGSVQPSARAFPSLRTGLFGRRSLATRVLSRAGRYPTELRPAHGLGGAVDWVSGACMLIRASAFWEIDGFDEDYWMYWEDADLCRRLSDRGWKVIYEPRAVIHHATGASGTSERTIRAFHESAAVFAAKHIATTPLQRRLIDGVLRMRTGVVLRSWAQRRHRA